MDTPDVGSSNSRRRNARMQAVCSTPSKRQSPSPAAATAPRLCTIKIARDEDLHAQIGHDNDHCFDLVDFSMVRAFEVAAETPFCRFKEQLAEEFGIPVESQRLWLWARRHGTYRPDRPLSHRDEKLNVEKMVSSPTSNACELHLYLEVLRPFPSWNLITEDDILVFLKLYNPGQMQLRYVSTLLMRVSPSPSEILHKLRTLAGFHADEEIELYEEIRFKPALRCWRIDIHSTFRYSKIISGDIICYQKMPEPEDRYPRVDLFFKQVLDQKDDQIRIHALEEEVAMLRYQARCEREARKECEELKQERDNAVRQVDELRDQNRYIILEFSIEDLEKATENFSDAYKVGDTEYGHVYEGIIHKTMVTIKLSRSQSLFQQEVSVLRQSKHPNIVTVIGICSEAAALVYEWLPNGTLEDCIIAGRNNSSPLPWHKRAEIIGDICCTLLFLHANKPSALVHGDLRPCNILMDANYKSKLCHFGMSNLFIQRGAFQPYFTERMPYMDPELFTDGEMELTPKSDVYSLGVIILHLLTGIPPLSIADEVASALESNTLHRMIDKSAGSWPYTQAKKLAILGLSCMERTREKRSDLLTKVWKVIQPMVKPNAAYIQSVSEGSPPPAHFFCPITMEIMKDPRVASDGFTYEAEAMLNWLNRGKNRSPMTNQKLTGGYLIPNHTLRSAIQEYLELQRQQGQVPDP